MYTYRGEGVTVVTSSAVYSFKMFGFHFFAFVFCVFFGSTLHLCLSHIITGELTI